MSKTSSAVVGADFADKYLGHEDNIDMDVQDARYRYYQWLREWYGMGKQEATNKCPFYQFMFWGSILMLVSIIPIIIMKFIEVFILKPLSWVIPKFVDQGEELIDKSKMMASWIITVALLLVSIAITGVISTNVIAWIGTTIHYLFVIPFAIVFILWLLLEWLITVALPWLFVGFLWIISIILTGAWTFILALISLPWMNVFILFLWFVGILLATTILIWLFYKIGIRLFDSSISKWIIGKSCIIREAQIERKKARKKRIKKAQEEKIEARFKWNQEHKEELAKKRELKLKKKLKKQDSFKMWRKFFSKANTGLWKILLVFPGFLFIGIWLVLKYIGFGIGYVIWGFAWLFTKVADFFVVIWSLLTETVSNHCPPIDFTIKIKDTGILKKHSSEEYLFICKNEDKTLIIPNDYFPDKFKATLSKHGRRGLISCTICTREFDRVLKGYGQYRHLQHLSNPIKVYKVNKLVYV